MSKKPNLMRTTIFVSHAFVVPQSIKTFFFLTILLFAAEGLWAQKATTLEERLALRASHTQSAVQQLRSHIQQNLEYPETMLPYCIEGTALLEVQVSEKGKVEEMRIVKSLNATFDGSIFAAMQNFKGLNYTDSYYVGGKILRIPVRFSMN